MFQEINGDGKPHFIFVRSRVSKLCFFILKYSAVLFFNLNQFFLFLHEKEDVLFRKYFRDHDGLALDVGVFCKAIEYATGVTAVNVGKPNPEYFTAGLSNINLAPNEVC